MLVIHKSCRSFDLEDGYGRQDFTYDIQRAIDDGVESLFLARDVLLEDDADEQHEFLAMFGKPENYDQVLGTCVLRRLVGHVGADRVIQIG